MAPLVAVVAAVAGLPLVIKGLERLGDVLDRKRREHQRAVARPIA